MTDNNDRLAGPAQRVEVVEALALKLLVTHRQHLVDKQHVRLHVHSDGEAEAHIHAAAVVLDRVVDELRQSAEVDDLVGDGVDLLARQAKDRSVQGDVLPARHVRMESRTKLDKGRDATVGGDGAVAGAIDAGKHLQQRRLARAVVTDQAIDAALGNLKGDIADRPEVHRVLGLAADDALLE